MKHKSPKRKARRTLRDVEMDVLQSRANFFEAAAQECARSRIVAEEKLRRAEILLAKMRCTLAAMSAAWNILDCARTEVDGHLRELELREGPQQKKGAKS